MYLLNNKKKTTYNDTRDPLNALVILSIEHESTNRLTKSSNIL